ncbi:thymidine kinase [Ornithinimicrobium faecis]|uniref:Thymidine kinase n=1 Tax=Ornithinimicrobium faecis TaxID=2934158 RepID=A0ABY4YZC6_9MICO|nr:thymidine kinase [Ornithinimicrobium sp. HY1793]USQ81996.1 thymidine kinase [Ornithinimicrobium sp. HY1793]
MRAAPVAGHVEVICGPMFAGKSEELVRRVRRARLAGLEVEVVNHALDARHGTGQVASHSGVSVVSRTAPDVTALRSLLEGRSPDLVAIDEAQFFGPGLVDVVDELAARGLTVLVAGLSVTFDGRPFEPLPTLMATAEVVTRLTAVCSVCGGEAALHQRVDTDATSDALAAAEEHVGGIESYQARCRHHHETAA